MSGIVLENITGSELTERARQLDPEKCYTVSIQEPVDRKRLIEELRAATARTKVDPNLRGVSDEEILRLVNGVVAYIRADRNPK